MSEQNFPANSLLFEATRQRLRDLRRGLLRLHKALLDDERAAYERVNGRISSGEMLQLVINHEQFAWLRSLSELIVRIDEMLDARAPSTSAIEADSLLAQSRQLLTPAAAVGSAFAQKYQAAIQREPGIALLHREAERLLAADAAPPAAAHEISDGEQRQ